METIPIKLKSDIEDVLDAFALNRNTECELLDKWLSVPYEFDDADKTLLEKKRKQLIDEGEFWNEEELKMRFLAFLLEIADIDEKGKIKVFFERPMYAIVNGYELNVICDAMVATPKGIGKPKKPYFFLQEFKKQKNSADAEGQMLMAMRIAQFENDNTNPVYGCWIQGRNWVFTTLHQNNYCISKQLDAEDKDDLKTIMCALKELKVIILKQLEDENYKVGI
jgi:hypothetical protein